MKILRATAVAALTFSALAASSYADICYLVYDRNDQVVYRDMRSPIDLSGPIGPQVNARWRGGALVIVGNADKCIPLDSVDLRTVANLAKPDAAAAPASTSKPAAEKATKAAAKKAG